MMDEGISDKTSQRICSHMNDDHAVSVHAMVKNALPYAEQLLSIKDAQMTSISLTGYNLSFVVCNGDLCSRRSITIDFVPPLSSGKECRPRLIEDHHKALSPKIEWIYQDPVMAIIIGIVSMMGLATHILGFDELVSTLNQHSNFSQMLNTLFGSVSTFASLVIYSYYFAVIAHLLEAIYTVYLCTTKLKTKTIITFKWFLLVSAVGYPATSKVMEFCSIDAKKRK